MQKVINKNRFKSICTLFFILFYSITQAQLADFSFSVVKTDETCESNGTLSFSVQNLTPEATVTYSIYLLPNTINPITSSTQSNYTGLNSGDYLIIATQNLNGTSNSHQETVTILDQVIALQYQLIGQNAVCINNGKITVNVTQGQAINFEIISGPILKPLQSSNVFTGLSAGVYLVRVYDSCGNGVVQTFTLFESTSSINISPITTVTVVDCDNAIVSQTLTSGDGVIFYPLTLEYTITLPNGQTNVITQTLSSGNDELITIDQNIPIAMGESVTYTLNIVDGCGTVFNDSGSILVPISTPNLSIVPNGCGINNYKVKNATSVVVITAPSTFTFPLPYVVPATGTNVFLMTNYPVGSYSLEVTSLCGVVSIIDFTVTASVISPPVISIRLGCENGKGSLRIAGPVNLVSGQLIQAPENAGFVTPTDISALLFGNPQGIYMNNLPSGIYSFSVVDECGTTHVLSANIVGYQEVKNVNIIEHCGSFDLFLNHITIPSVGMNYILQKFYTNENFWGDPIIPSEDGGLPLGNNAITYNIASSGHFRIIGKYSIFGNGGPQITCETLINEFDFYTLPQIDAVVNFGCDSNTFDIFVDAVGIGALKYKIIAKDGIPIIIDNLTNPIFSNLQAATYTFQIEDDCGNLLVADFEVGNSQSFGVIAGNLCPQQNATLSVANFDFLSYQWWKGSDTSTILSTTNSLTLPNFNPTTDSGIYHVRIYYSALPNSCIDVQTDYTIDVTDYVLNAGENTAISYCENPGTINLFSVLNGNPDSNGTWQELTNSGLLNGSTWNSSSVSNGIYNFKYTVSGLCNEVDSAIVQITINSIPEDISITVNPIICSGESIEFLVNYIENATYSWQGPNDFSSTLQNPIIENASILNSGTYSLIVKLGECESETINVNVDVKSLPDFVVAGNCVKDDSDYELKVEPIDLNINSDDFTYSWNNESGYLGSENPISILGKPPGIYNVTITDNLGCSVVESFEVKGTVCKIPKGISPNNDGDNDNFDLAGFDVKNIIIYSRYGRIVYEKKNYLNEWHGQDFKGRNLPDATYFYHIETYSGQEFVGWVYKIH